MDVTAEIQRNNNVYGPSTYTGKHTLSASRSLNFAEGASIQKPQVENLSVIPFTFKYQDAVGLFGAENHFIRVNVNVDRDFSRGCFEEEWFECAEITNVTEDLDFYTEASIDNLADTGIENSWEPPIITPFTPVPQLYDAYISVSLKNLKVGNKYLDDYLDVRLYTKDREEFDGDYMYVHLKDYFYLGVHARNTRRLPYNIELTVGEELRSELPTNECNDTWEIIPDGCACVEEPGYECGEMALFNEVDAVYEQGEVFPSQDTTTENSYEASRTVLQGSECINKNLANFLGLPTRGTVGQVPPPKERAHTTKGHLGDPCCATCH